MMKAVLTTPTVPLLVLVPVVLKMITVIKLMTPVHLNDLRLLLLDQKNSSQTGNCHHTIHIYIACTRKGVSFANCKLCLMVVLTTSLAMLMAQGINKNSKLSNF